MNGPASDQEAALQRALAVFVGDDPGRSVALRFTSGLRDHGGPTTETLHVNGDALRPVASVIKVALVAALYDEARAGRLSLDEQVPVRTLGATRYCSIMKAFDADRTLSLAELAAIALTTSDNPVAVLLEDRVGHDAVNAVLTEAGVPSDRRMHVGFREHELGPRNRANVLSSLDVLALFDHLAARPHYAPVIIALENNLRNARIPALLPDEAVIAHKTGSLEGVVNDAGIVRLGDNRFTVAFLTDGQADPAQTERDIAACAFSLHRLLLAG